MKNPMIKEHNVETGEVVERAMNETEFAQFEAEEAARQLAQATAEAKAAARDAILERLGLTSDEAALLLG
jgi:1,2-phenylacetyl-CoA epoxidase catalytic subunit